MRAVEENSNSTQFPDLIALLEQQALRYGDKPVYSHLDRQLQATASISFRELYEQAVKLAATLQALGLGGRNLLMLYLPGKDFPVAFWGAILAGACPVPVARPRGRDWDVIERIIRRADAAAVIGSAALLKLLPDSLQMAVAILPHEELTLEPEHRSSKRHDSADNCKLKLTWQRPTVTGAEPALLQFTSGSTGEPKGVMLSHANILDNLSQISRFFACDDRDIGLCWLPLHHDMGLIGHVLQPVFAGIHNYFMTPAHFLGRPLQWLEAIDKVGATISGAPCFAYSLCVESMRHKPAPRLNLANWRVAYCGAEKISAVVLHEFYKRLQAQGMQANALYPCYGLAESTLFVTGRHRIKVVMGQSRRNVTGPLLVSVGPAYDQVRVVNLEEGRLCEEFEVGEVCLTSPSVAVGYYNDVVATTASFNLSLKGIGDRLLRTGDLAMVADGELYLVGRTKNLIKSRGRPVHAEDIEQLVMDEGRGRGVARCAVIGTEHYDQEGIAVLVEMVRTTDPSQTLQLRHDIQQLIAERSGVVPHNLTILAAGALPLTTSGKVQRFACQPLIGGE